jgi:EmrB/QacA subfamily drug resistance transporter
MTEQLNATQKRWTLIAVILGSAIVFLDTSVVNLALPKIGEELSTSLFNRLEAQSYVANGYFLTLSALLVLAGRLSDLRGRKRMFGIGLAGFLVTSFLCAIAPTMELLIAFRVLQGAAGALVVPGSLAIITATFEGEEQGRAFGIWAGASAATTILGPPVGGFLVSAISWRAAFFINVPFLIVALNATRRHVPESRDEHASPHLDWLGSLVLIVAVGGLSFGTIRGQALDWKGVEPFVSLAVGGVAAVLFPLLMLRREHALVPPSLFRSRNFTVTNIATFVIYGALYVTITFQSLFLIGTLGYTPSGAAIASIPSTLLLVLFSTKFGGLAARLGPRLFMTAGPIIMGLGLLWLVRFPAGSDPWAFRLCWCGDLLPPKDYLIDLLPSLVVFGAGLMMMVAPLTTALMTSIPREKAGVGSAINNAISRVGAPLVTAIIFVAVVSSFYGAIQDRVPTVDTDAPSFRLTVAPLNPPERGVSDAVTAAAREASTESFHLAMLVAVGLMLIGAAVNGFGIQNRPTVPVEERTAEPAEPDLATAGARTDPSGGVRTMGEAPRAAPPARTATAGRKTSAGKSGARSPVKSPVKSPAKSKSSAKSKSKSSAKSTRKTAARSSKTSSATSGKKSTGTSTAKPSASGRSTAKTTASKSSAKRGSPGGGSSRKAT